MIYKQVIPKTPAYMGNFIEKNVNENITGKLNLKFFYHHPRSQSISERSTNNSKVKSKT